MIRPTVAAALLLLAAAWYWRQQQAEEGAELVDPDDYEPTDEPADTTPDLTDEISAAMSTVRNFIAPTPAAGMSTSPAGLVHLQGFERLSLTPYRLGDGGTTIGWGRFYPDGGAQPPVRIDRATADAWFAQDVQERGERWVKAFVTVPLTQPQFDALVSMAFNLSPKSFRTIADAVNRGDDPEAAALRFVRAGTNLERGLRNRRAAELAMFRADASTYTA